MGKRREGREGEPFAPLALGAHGTEKLSNFTEARPIRRKMYHEPDMQSDFIFRHDSTNRAIALQGEYLLECVKVLLQLSRERGRQLVEGQLSIFQRADDSDFPTFPSLMRTQKHCSQVRSRPSDGDVMNANFCTRVYRGGQTWQKMLCSTVQQEYSKNFSKQWFLGGVKDILFRCHHNP